MKNINQLDAMIRSFVECLKLDSKSDNTIKNYKNSALHFLHYLNDRNNGLLEYSQQDVISYAEAKCAKGLAVSSVVMNIKSINALSHFLDNGAVVKVKEIAFLKNLNEVDSDVIILSKKAQEEIYKCALTLSLNDKRNISIILLFLETGIKISELITLNEIDLAEINNSQYIKVHSKMERVIPISRELYFYINNCISYPKTELPLFKSNWGKRYTIRTLQRMLQNNGVTSQILRDTYIYNLLRNDVDTYIISQLAGLSVLDTLKEKYYNNEYKKIDEFRYNCNCSIT